MAIIMNILKENESTPVGRTFHANRLEMVLGVFPFNNRVIFGMKK